MKHFHGSTHFRFTADALSGGTAQPFDLRHELNAMYTTCMVVIRPLERKAKMTKIDIDLYKKTSVLMGEAAEQLEVLNWCDFMRELDAENLKKALKAFDEETEKMRVTA